MVLVESHPRSISPCEGMTEEQIAPPTLQDKTAILGTREEDQAIYPTLKALLKRT